MSSPSSKPSSRRFVPRIALVALGLVIVLAVLYFLNVAALYRQERREAADQSAFLAQAMARTAAMRAASSLRVLDFGLLEQRGMSLLGDPALA